MHRWRGFGAHGRRGTPDPPAASAQTAPDAGRSSTADTNRRRRLTAPIGGSAPPPAAGGEGEACMGDGGREPSFSALEPSEAAIVSATIPSRGAVAPHPRDSSRDRIDWLTTLATLERRSLLAPEVTRPSTLPLNKHRHVPPLLFLGFPPPVFPTALSTRFARSLLVSPPGTAGCRHLARTRAGFTISAQRSDL